MTRSLKCLVSSTPSDAHTWSLVTLELLLEELGHEVTNLGPCPPQDLIVSTCRALRPDLLVISTTNGHGQIEAPELIRRIRSNPPLSALPVVIGGKLSCTAGPRQTCDDLVAAGFDAAFNEREGLRPFVQLVGEIANRDAGARHLTVS